MGFARARFGVRVSPVLSLSAPLRSLLDLARAEGLVSSQADLGARRRPPVTQGVVGQALALGDRVQLSTLASYAWAAGYVVLMQVSGGDGRRYSGIVGDLDVGVGTARALLDALGLEMTLVIEPRETR